MYQIQYFIQKYILVILSIIVLFLVGILIWAIRFRQPPAISTESPSITPTVSISPIVQEQGFHVLTVSPAPGATNVYSGEIVISFTTDNPVQSQNDLAVDITPAVPNYWKYTNTFPSKNIQVQVYGGLKTSTIYTVTVRNAQGTGLKQWSFTTGATPPQDSSREVVDKENQQLAQDYPLYKYLPYSTGDFDVGYYEDKLTLPVTIRSSDHAKAQQELFDWVKSKGVDPATHTFIYTYVQ